jgi:hypothetical protein
VWLAQNPFFSLRIESNQINLTFKTSRKSITMADQHEASTSTLYVAGAGFDQPGGQGLPEEDEQLLRAAVQSRGTAKPRRLREFTVMCMIFNRMIGMTHSCLTSVPSDEIARDWDL